MDNIETLRERLRIKFKDGDGYFYKYYLAKDVKIIKDVEVDESISADNADDLKELEKLEKLEKAEQENEAEDY